ncbi:MAG: aspartyl/asparaginyl beta-hydroxylase domain-containing protein [Flavobacteriales bacterium]|nr:aspartyl/asparaginyl beta-hydroxylase domain-containing protein [Flavobacteriales bacterium]
MPADSYVWPEGEEIVYLRPPKEEYTGKLEYFYDPSLFPELQPLVDNWQLLREEIVAHERTKGIMAEMDSHVPPTNTKDQWSHIYLMNYLWKFHRNLKRFPVITSVIEKIPNCVYATISVLPPHTDILPHCGNSNGIVRAHIALIIPAPAPVCAIKVGDEMHGWEEGKLLTFTIVNRHEAWNRSDHRRYIMIIDIVPEMFRHRTMEICAKNLGTSTFNVLYDRFRFIGKLPNAVHELMVASFSIFWRLYLPIQRRLTFL